MRLLFKHYSGALMTVIAPVIPQKEIAEEVLHDVLIKVWTNIESYDSGKSRFFTWMARIARNAAIDKTRSKNFRKAGKTDGIDVVVSRRKELSQTPSVDHIGITTFLEKLDASHRAVIELLYLQGFTQAEAAEELSLPLGTVKTRSRRAILQLRKLLKHEMVWLIFITALKNIPTF